MFKIAEITPPILLPPNLPDYKNSLKHKADEKTITCTNQIWLILKGLALIGVGATMALTALNGYNALTTATGVLGLLILIGEIGLFSKSSLKKTREATQPLIASVTPKNLEKSPFMASDNVTDSDSDTEIDTHPAKQSTPKRIEDSIIIEPRSEKTRSTKENLNPNVFTPRKQFLTPRQNRSTLLTPTKTPNTLVNKLLEIHRKNQKTEMTLEEKKTYNLNYYKNLYSIILNEHKKSLIEPCVKEFEIIYEELKKYFEKIIQKLERFQLDMDSILKYELEALLNAILKPATNDKTQNIENILNKISEKINTIKKLNNIQNYPLIAFLGTKHKNLSEMFKEFKENSKKELSIDEKKKLIKPIELEAALLMKYLKEKLKGNEGKLD